jgi:hypothetical protein
MSAVEGRTDMLLKRADLQRFYQFSGTDWLMREPIDRRVRVSCCTWLTLGLWPMTALRQQRPFHNRSRCHSPTSSLPQLSHTAGSRRDLQGLAAAA